MKTDTPEPTRDEFPNVEALADGRINNNTFDEYRGLKAECKRLLDARRKLREELIRAYRERLYEAGQTQAAENAMRDRIEELEGKDA